MVGMFLGLLCIAPVVFFYFLVIKGIDRYEPEPWWLLILAFLWGAFGATFFAIIGNELGGFALGLALEANRGDALLQASTASFVAPLVEESTKGFGLLVLWAASALWLREIDGTLDGAIYGGVIGLGFTLTEDVLYVGAAAQQAGAVGFGVVFVLRTLMAGLGHASFTAMTGLGVGLAVESRSLLVKVLAPIGGWTAAVGLHALHNLLVTFLMAGGLGLLLKLLIFWVFDALLFILLFVLVLRDRSIVVRGLADEVGRLLGPQEFKRTTSYVMLIPLGNFFSLLGSPGGYTLSRKKQLDLVKLAFLKQRRRRGERSAALDLEEARLRDGILRATHHGVLVGAG